MHLWWWHCGVELVMWGQLMIGVVWFYNFKFLQSLGGTRQDRLALVS